MKSRVPVKVKVAAALGSDDFITPGHASLHSASNFGPYAICGSPRSTVTFTKPDTARGFNKRRLLSRKKNHNRSEGNEIRGMTTMLARNTGVGEGRGEGSRNATLQWA